LSAPIAITLADLFSAVRGGGSFGVVTAIEGLLDETPELYTGAMFRPIDRAAEVLHAWRAWIETVPDTVTLLGGILHLPRTYFDFVERSVDPERLFMPESYRRCAGSERPTIRASCSSQTTRWLFGSPGG
jgi:hypothetical protein